MTRLQWGNAGDRRFETGVDRGVLYPKVGSGLAWNGLVSVQERVSGGSPSPYYYDGLKYINLASAEDFGATIEAFSSPQEFDISDGVVEIARGLSGTQQARAQFGFCYRTGVGNDVDGLDYGYKIHLVYNALAQPASRDYTSLGSSQDPVIFSWDIATLAPDFAGYKPSAHFVIDSTITHSTTLQTVEDYLYGTDTTASTLPTPEELVSMFATMVYGYGHGPYGHGPYGGN